MSDRRAPRHFLPFNERIISTTPAQLTRIKRELGRAPLRKWAGILLASVPDTFFDDHPASQVIELVNETYRILQKRKKNQIVIHQSGKLLMVLQDDRPFLVRSLRELLRQNETRINVLLHPLVSCRRRPNGSLADFGEVTLQGARESFIIIQLEEQITPALREKVVKLMEDIRMSISDFQKMDAKLTAARESIDSYRGIVPDDEREETAAFFDWLQKGNFVLLGYREYGLFRKQGKTSYGLIHGTGLGLLSREKKSRLYHPAPLSKLERGLRHEISEGPLLVLSKTNSTTAIYRGGRMDYIGLRRIDEKGRVIGEIRFLGLISDRANYDSKIDVPLLRKKYAQIREAFRAIKGSFEDREIAHLFSGQQVDTLLLTETRDLVHEFELTIRGYAVDEVRTAARYDPVRRGIAMTLVMPQERYKSSMRDLVTDAATPIIGATGVETRIIADSSEGGIVRLQFFFSTDRQNLKLDRLAREVLAAVRSWSQRLEESLRKKHGEKCGEIFRKYSESFNDAYQVIVAPELAADDIDDLEIIENETIIRWGRPSQYLNSSYLKIFHPHRKLAISELAPILVNHGFTVDEENSFPISHANRTTFLHIFRLKTDRTSGRATTFTDDPQGRAVAHSMLATFKGTIDNDSLCGLVTSSGLSIREIELLRAIRNFARQTGTIPARKSVNTTLLAHPGAAKILIDLFKSRFDPKAHSEKSHDAAKRAFDDYIADVPSLDDDRALRVFFHIIESALRTSYYVTGNPYVTDASPPIAIKFDPARIPGLIAPRPWREIFVYGGAAFEGCHLRGGPVARGGLRWSERPDDFRTEVLGLMKTQVTKNAQIVPTGAKGGFVVKRLPVERDARAEEVKRCYRLFISSMLDMQDNVDAKTKKLVKPRNVVCYDGDDPYFVVAADKGTATYSDTANEIARRYSFWLDDAFASGGSNGYDHKKEGITAKGAWVSVERHFKDSGRNIEKEPFTVVGVGDMSGDVFGNGMLLSKNLKLIAAFDHRDIFLDPNPDPAESFIERKRLFALPRSSWADYNPKKISKGGGVHSRSMKSIPISPEVRNSLGITNRTLDPESLIRAILAAKVDLLYNGGIGTYVKASFEHNSEVGDSQNDLTRVSASQLRCAIVSEGGNLGFTQAARIEFALAGGKIFTDAIDNSGGVDLSDHEVNLKILIDRSNKARNDKERTQLIMRYKKAIIGDVLRDNYLQTIAVALDEVRSRRRLSAFANCIVDLERRSVINVALEGLPDPDTFRDRTASSVGLTKPELSVLLAHAKRDIKARLLDSPIKSRPKMDRFTELYFAPEVRAHFKSTIPQHGLRDDLLVTVLTNSIVNFHGATVIHRLTTELGLATSRVVESLLLAREIVDADALIEELFSLDGRMPSAALFDELLQLDDCVILVARWLIRNIRDLRGRMAEGLDEYAALHRRFFPIMKKILSEESRTGLENQVRHRIDAGFPKATAERLALLDFVPSLLDVVHLAITHKTTVEKAGALVYDIGSRLRLEYLIQKIKTISAHNDWEFSATFDMISELRRSRQRIATRIMDLGGDIDGFIKERFRSFETLQAAIARIEGEEPTSLAPYIVISTQIRNLAAL